MPADAAASLPSATDLQRRVEELSAENALLRTEMREASQRHTATSEVLDLINSSAGDYVTVCETILIKAHALCGVARGSLQLYDGETFRAVALHNAEGDVGDRLRQGYKPGPYMPVRQLLEGAPFVHVRDLAEIDHPIARGAAKEGIGTTLYVALRKDDRVLGQIVAAREGVRHFSDEEIALLQSFAKQAVIAIENARLINEQREALERQTATTEILEVINSSPGSLAPVFDTILAKATELCEAEFGILWLYKDGFTRAAAYFNVPPAYAAFLGHRAHLVNPINTHGRLLPGEGVVHIADITADEAYVAGDPLRRAVVELGGGRAQITVPLRKDGAFLGDFVIYRKVPGPFSDKHSVLLQGFAAQALIAIENARLFEELSDRQAELRVTLDNTGDGVVMFDADFRLASWNRNFQEMLDIPDGFVAGRPGFDDYLRLLVGRGELGDGDPEGIVAGYRERVTRQWSAERTRPDGRIIEVRNNPVPDGGAVLIYSDITERKRAEAEIAAARDAAEEALEQQTATAEILRAISQSPTDVQPVLDAVVKAAVRFCGATDAVIILREGDGAFFAAHEGPTVVAVGSSFPMNRETSPGRAILDGRTCHLPDIASLDPVEFAAAHRLAAAQGFRASLAAPLLRQDTAIGSVTLRKAEVGPFTPRQIELLETFAAQAVIAIENVRLFNDLREALEQQTATADILSVISRSPTDVQPVLEAVTRAALRFCGAPDALVLLRDGDENVVAAHEGTLTATLGLRRPITGNFSGQALLEGRTLQIADVEELDAAGYAGVLALARQHKWRASAAAPMMHGGNAIGCVFLRKPEPGLLSSRQIALLETFAAQAVIAIENVRLFTELREALDQQTATAEILRVISQSPTDVNPVLAAVVKAALKFCGARDALVSLRDGDTWFIAAHEGPIEATRGPRPLTRGTAHGRAMVDGVVAHVADLQSPEADDYPEAREYGAREGFRAVLAAPLLRDNVPIGAISLRRPEPGAFTPNQVDLLRSFAAQAVIAIENVRLFTELRESLEQQTATAEILRAISQSPTDVQPVLDAVAKAAVRFCGATDALITLRDGDDMMRIASQYGPLLAQRVRVPLDPTRLTALAIVEGRTVHMPDVATADPAKYAKMIHLGRQIGFQAAVAAPMLLETDAIGSIVLRKSESGAFTQRQIELLETFAAQAVIAIENVRLFTELRDSLERLKAAQANLIQSEKMASLGQLTAGIAHEIKNPLNFVNNFAGLSCELLGELKDAVDALLADPDDDKRVELNDTIEMLNGNLAKILEHGRRADGIVKSMLAHSRGGTGDWQSSNINGLVEEALNLAYHGARAQDQSFNVTLERDFGAALKPIDVVPQDITRVFLNLFGNGFYAIRKRQRDAGDGGYQPTLRVSTRDLDEVVDIRVRDNGTGIAAEVRDKLFQPFFTTKPTGEGTGLGLSISYDIVTQQHGGSIEVESELGQYSEFTVRLPRAPRVPGRSESIR